MRGLDCPSPTLCADSVFSYGAVVDGNAYEADPLVIPLSLRGPPSWGNTSTEKQPMAPILHGSTPDLYAECWNHEVSRRRSEVPEPILFINAWNEGSEGINLEPDSTGDCQYLEKTREILLGRK